MLLRSLPLSLGHGNTSTIRDWVQSKNLYVSDAECLQSESGAPNIAAYHQQISYIVEH